MCRPRFLLALWLALPGCQDPRAGGGHPPGGGRDGAADAPAVPDAQHAPSGASPDGGGAGGPADAGPADGSPLAPPAPDGPPATACQRCPGSGMLCVDLSTWPQHCGACGRDCAGGTCLNGRCQPHVVAAGLGKGTMAGAGATFDGQELFFVTAEPAMVLAASVTDGRVRTLATPSGVAEAVSVWGEHVYWVESRPEALHFMRIARTGGAAEELARTAGPERFAASLQVHQDHLYWHRRGEERTTAALERTRIGSGRVERLLESTPADLDPVFWVHPTGLFIMKRDYAQQIQRLPLAGGPAVTIHESTEYLFGLLALTADHVYWALPDGAIWRRHLAGDRPASALGKASFPALGARAIVHGQTLFVFGTVNAGILSIPLVPGPVPQEVVPPGRSSYPAALGVDDRFVYWLGGEGTLFRVLR